MRAEGHEYQKRYPGPSGEETKNDPHHPRVSNPALFLDFNVKHLDWLVDLSGLNVHEPSVRITAPLFIGANVTPRGRLERQNCRSACAMFWRGERPGGASA
jgi:hypothetical protein